MGKAGKNTLIPVRVQGYDGGVLGRDGGFGYKVATSGSLL